MDGNISADPIFYDLNDNYLCASGRPLSMLVTIALQVFRSPIWMGFQESLMVTVGGAVVDIGALEFSNRPPTADAGPDQTVAITTNCLPTITLDARGSSDLNGDQLSFNWTGPFGTVSGPTPTVSLPKGTHVITLTIADGNGGTTQDTVVVTVII